MIVSVSRRGDIPAFASDGFMEWLRRGVVEIKNPFRPDRQKRVSLKKQDVDAFVFWSRDPRPLLKHLREIDLGGYPYYFLLTVTGYPRLLEPSTPPIEEAAGFFRGSGRAHRPAPRHLALRSGDLHEANRFRFSRRQFLRAGRSPGSVHFARDRQLFRSLPQAGQATEKGRDRHAGGKRQSVPAGGTARPFCRRGRRRTGIEIQSCAEARLGRRRKPGRQCRPLVGPGKCVDDELLNELFGLHYSLPQGPRAKETVPLPAERGHRQLRHLPPRLPLLLCLLTAGNKKCPTGVPVSCVKPRACYNLWQPLAVEVADEEKWISFDRA